MDDSRLNPVPGMAFPVRTEDQPPCTASPAGEFRNNTDWFIPSFPYNLVDRNGHYDWGWKGTTHHTGNSPEYAINPAGTVATPDKTVLGYGYTDVLTVKIEHNGKTETHRINVYTETRGCAYNQQ